jgi:hypothetical protein
MGEDRVCNPQSCSEILEGFDGRCRWCEVARGTVRKQLG